jgi:hypothetical protein
MTLDLTTRTLITTALLSGAALLTGCAGLRNVTADVSTFGTWPKDRKPNTYAFERLPSQKSNPLEQDALERAATPAIEQAGFKPDVPEKAEVLIQVSAQTQVRPSPFNDPYGPRWSVGWGMGSWNRYGGMGMGMTMDPPWWQLQVDVLIRDRASHEVLYEAHARHERAGSVDGLAEPLFRAALTDFPLPAVSPRPVTVEVPPKN